MILHKKESKNTPTPSSMVSWDDRYSTSDLCDVKFFLFAGIADRVVVFALCHKLAKKNLLWAREQGRHAPMKFDFLRLNQLWPSKNLKSDPFHWYGDTMKL